MRCSLGVKYIPDFQDLVQQQQKNVKYLTKSLLYELHVEMIIFYQNNVICTFLTSFDVGTGIVKINTCGSHFYRRPLVNLFYKMFPRKYRK